MIGIRPLFHCQAGKGICSSLHLLLLSNLFSAFFTLNLCPRIWYGITRLDSGNEDGVGEEKQHTIAGKVKKCLGYF